MHGWAKIFPLSTCLATGLCYCASVETSMHCLSSLLLRLAASRLRLLISIIATSPRCTSERKLVLVRPDGHVAWREDACPDDASVLIDRVRGAGSA